MSVHFFIIVVDPGVLFQFPEDFSDEVPASAVHIYDTNLSSIAFALAVVWATLQLIYDVMGY